MTPQEFSQKIKAKYPQYTSVDDTVLAQKMIAKYPQYQSQVNFTQPQENTGILGPAKDAIQGLQTLYGGGEQGIAQKLASDVKAGAQDMEQGNYFKGALKAGGRVAGDVAGAIFAPIGAALQATGINRLFDKAGSAIAESPLVNKITDIPAVQNFASAHPNAGEDFIRVLNLAMSGGGGDITVQGLKDAAMSPIPVTKSIASGVSNLRPTAKSVQQARQTKLNEGFAEQNTRLKSAGKSFNENTKTYTDPATKQKVTVTPIDTFAEHNIAPVVEKGTIKMGDWKTGEGELGKIKNAVDTIDNQVDTVLTDSQKLHPIDQLEHYTIAKIKNNTDLQAGGKVSATVKKLQTVFDDFRDSYGEEITTTQMNEIRKVMNRDWNPDTVDASRAIGDVAREIVYNATPDLKVKELLRKEGELLSAKKYAETINGTKVVGGRLGNMAMRTAGAIIGSGLEKAPIIGPVIGMIGGEYAARALQQSQFKSAWTELKGLIQSNKTEPSQSANNTPKTAIASKYTPQSVKKVGNPMPTATKIVKDYVKNPKLGLSMEDITKNLDATDIRIMSDFASDVKTGYVSPELARKAQDIADAMNLNESFATNKVLAKKFTEILEAKKANPTRAVPIQTSTDFLTEARKYKTAQEFVKDITSSEIRYQLRGGLDKISKETDIKSLTGSQKTEEKTIAYWKERINENIMTPGNKGAEGFAPIIVDGNKVIDGFHKLQAYKELGFGKVPTIDKSQLTDIWKQAHPEQQFSPEVQRLINMLKQ